MEHLKNENIWLKKSAYEEAETQYYEKLAKVCIFITKLTLVYFFLLIFILIGIFR